MLGCMAKPVLYAAAGEELKRLMQLKQVKSDDLAASAGITTQAVYAWRRGEDRPGLDKFPVLRQIFNADIQRCIDIWYPNLSPVSTGETIEKVAQSPNGHIPLGGQGEDSEQSEGRNLGDRRFDVLSLLVEKQDEEIQHIKKRLEMLEKDDSSAPKSGSKRPR